MMLFWSLLALLCVIAILFIVLPLWYGRTKDTPQPVQTELNIAIFKERITELHADLEQGRLSQNQYDNARTDLERELLADADSDGFTTEPSPAPKGFRRQNLFITVFAVIAVPVVVMGLYLKFGMPDIVDYLLDYQAPKEATSAPDKLQEPTLDELIKRLQDRLAKKPDDVDGWKILARTLMAMNKPKDAEEAYAKALALQPDNVEIILPYAEAMAASQPDGEMAGKPEALVDSVLAKQPDNPAALWFKGIAAFQQNKYAEAVTLWQRVLTKVPADSDQAIRIKEMIGKAQANQDAADKK